MALKLESAEVGLPREERIRREIHDLRRTLQLMALRPHPPAELGELAAAVDAIESLLSGSASAPASAPASASARPPTALRELVDEAVERFQSAGLAKPGQISIMERDSVGKTPVEPIAAGRAVSNLVANALEHGTGDVELELTSAGDRARLAVTNRATATREGGRPGQGLGLAIVNELAACSGGSFSFELTEQAEAVAILDLQARPLNPAAVPRSFSPGA